MAMIGLNVQHDANHGAASKYPAINGFFGYFADAIGGSRILWCQQHWTHHSYTNDIQHGTRTQIILFGSCLIFYLFIVVLSLHELMFFRFIFTIRSRCKQCWTLLSISQLRRSSSWSINSSKGLPRLPTHLYVTRIVNVLALYCSLEWRPFHWQTRWC